MTREEWDNNGLDIKWWKAEVDAKDHRIAQLEEALREIDSDPSQNILSDKHRKLLENR